MVLDPVVELEKNLGLLDGTLEALTSVTPNENLALNEIRRTLGWMFRDMWNFLYAIETISTGNYVVSMGYMNGRFIPRDEYAEQTVKSSHGHHLLKAFYLEDDGDGTHRISGFGKLDEIWSESVEMENAVYQIAEMLLNSDVWQKAPRVEGDDVVVVYTMP